MKMRGNVEGEEEGNEGEEVNQIHQTKEELDLSRTGDESDEVLYQEEDDHDVLRDVDDVHDVDQHLVVRIPLFCRNGKIYIIPIQHHQLPT